jgi:hypothetical protein
MGISDKDRSPVGIDGCNAAPTPTGFAEIVSDDFPVLHTYKGSISNSSEPGLHSHVRGCLASNRSSKKRLSNMIKIGNSSPKSDLHISF